MNYFVSDLTKYFKWTPEKIFNCSVKFCADKWQRKTFLQNTIHPSPGIDWPHLHFSYPNRGKEQQARCHLLQKEIRQYHTGSKKDSKTTFITGARTLETKNTRLQPRFLTLSYPSALLDTVFLLGSNTLNSGRSHQLWQSLRTYQHFQKYAKGRPCSQKAVKWY